jgi:hypothetical protein
LIDVRLAAALVLVVFNGLTALAAPGNGGEKQLSETVRAPAAAAPANSFMVYGGWGTDTNFTQTVYAPWSVNFVDLQFVGATVSTRLGTVGDLAESVGQDLGSIGEDFTLEAELGGGYRFGDEKMGEFWTALYLRYDGFPWNDMVYTTIAANLGLSILTKESDFERSRDADPDEGDEGNASQVLHFFSPEITVADPDNKNLELVLRLHHRSGVFGLIDGITSGSTFITTGVRVRF